MNKDHPAGPVKHGLAKQGLRLALFVIYFFGSALLSVSSTHKPFDHILTEPPASMAHSFLAYPFTSSIATFIIHGRP